MAQPSVANYFHTRKRSAIDDLKADRAKRILLENKSSILEDQPKKIKEVADLTPKVHQLQLIQNAKPIKKVPKTTKPRKVKEVPNQLQISDMFNSIANTNIVLEKPIPFDPVELHKTPPSTPTKTNNAMDKIRITGRELNFNELKTKLSRSTRLAELKASMSRFKESANRLEKIEKKLEATNSSPGLKSFKSIELEVTLSPKKLLTPEKAYLSPRKDTSVRKNLLNLLSPTKNAVSTPASPVKQLFAPQKPSLTLPYKYRVLAEFFRSIDTVCQIMHNRKETITFRKLKPAVEELLKRNIHEKHLAQIKTIYPEAYTFKQEKLRVYGNGNKHEQWELVIEPVLHKEAMTSESILERCRKMYNIMIEKLKVYHNEFLLDLDPPMVIEVDKIIRWHPEFDIEKVPDVELSELPQPPFTEKFTTGKDVLEKARTMFNCNTRMEQALERLKTQQEEKTEVVEKVEEVKSVLKGIPQSLLEKVRQRQAAKALQSITRSDENEKEVQLFSRLPEIARLTRNIFVAEKKSVLPIEAVLEKLLSSLRSFLPKSEIEIHLKTLIREVPGFIVLHNIRNNEFVKVSKTVDLSLVVKKLDKLIEQKKKIT